MGGIIIASPKAESAATIAQILKSGGFETFAICELGSQTLQKAAQSDGGIVICTPKLKDMGYVQLLEYLPECYEMLLLTREPQSFDPYDRLVKLINPFKRSDLLNTVDMMLARTYGRGRKSRPKTVRSADESNIIDRAKKLLMDRNDMTEPEAFRYLQKNSMDSGRNMVECAQMVIALNCDR